MLKSATSINLDYSHSPSVNVNNAGQKLDCSFYYYRTSTGQEVDLIIELPGKRIVAVEIKAKSKFKTGDFHGLLDFKKHHSQAKLVVISLLERAQKFDNGILALPWKELPAVFDF